MLKYFLSSFIFFLSLYSVTAQHTNEEKILRARSIGIKDSTSGFQILDSLLPRLTKNSEFALYYKSHGVINYYWKKPLNALSLYERSILYYKKENNYVELCNTYNNIGLVYEDLNEADKAVYSFNQSMHFAEISGDVCCKTKASLNMANYYNKLHIISKCDEYSSKAVQYALLCKDSSLIVTAYNIRGVLFSSEKKKDSALVNYRISARYSYLINDQNNYAVALNNISHVFLSYNQYDSSSFYLLRSKDVFEQINNTYGLFSVYNDLGNLMVKKKKYAEALSYYKTSEKYATESAGINEMITIHGNLSSVYESLRDFKNAYKERTLQINLQDSLRDLQLSKEVLDLEEKYKNKQNELQIKDLTQQKKIAELDAFKRENEIKWQSRWKWVLAIVLGLLSILFYFIISKIQVARKKSAVTSELKQLDIEYKLLRTQMNPHFLFNVLNSVQSIVAKEEREKAEIVLAKFGKLIRNLLLHSRKEWIGLDEELDQIKLYIQLEELRFPDKFSFHLILHPSLNQEEIEIPSMILQPFVENAILHGISKLTDRFGKISIEISPLDNDMIKCEISDNGVGRKQSAEHKELSNHISLATKLIEERLKMIKNNSNTNYSITYQDLTEGTKVTLIFPYKQNF